MIEIGSKSKDHRISTRITLRDDQGQTLKGRPGSFEVAGLKSWRMKSGCFRAFMAGRMLKMSAFGASQGDAQGSDGPVSVDWQWGISHWGILHHRQGQNKIQYQWMGEYRCKK